MPTSASVTYTVNRVTPLVNADDAEGSQLPFIFQASATLAAGTVVGEVTATPGTVKAYASGNSDGSQNPVGILKYAVTTDGSGNITNWSEWPGVTLTQSPVYIQGTFKTNDLTGLDANAVTKLGGHLVQGTVSSGILTF